VPPFVTLLVTTLNPRREKKRSDPSLTTIVTEHAIQT